jgi:hypothetical protein
LLTFLVSRLHRFLFVVLANGIIKVWHWGKNKFRWTELGELYLTSVSNKSLNDINKSEQVWMKFFFFRREERREERKEKRGRLEGGRTLIFVFIHNVVITKKRYSNS